MIPLLHDFTGERVLVFGGGFVGARRARIFAAEARVVVVSPAFADADFGGACLVRAAPDAADIPGWIDRASPALVVAATDDDALNAAIASASRDAGLLVNRIDTGHADPARSVVVPAIVRDGPVVAAIATGGASPSLSGALRRRIAADLEGAGAVAELTADLRRELRADGVPLADRRRALRAVVESDRVWRAVGNDCESAAAVVRDVAEGALSAGGS